MSLDAFGRLRVANPFTTFRYYPTPLTPNSNYDEDQFLTFTSASNTSISYDSQNFVSMNLTGGGAGFIVRQSKCPMEYQPGKSRIVLISCVPLVSGFSGTVQANIGLMNSTYDSTGSHSFTITQGIYFATDGTTLSWVRSLQGTVTTVNQSSWNIDKFDGNGPSGLSSSDIDTTKTMLLVIDQEWLGVGRVRCGFYVNGILYYAHQFVNSGQTIQYTSTPKQYITHQLTTSGSATASMRQMYTRRGVFPTWKTRKCK
jgi:hypothetical protein